MAISLSDKNKRKYSADELEVLGGVIDYADRMIFEENRRGEYGPLRRHAYGKTVVIETERQGTKIFRLSSTPVLYPNSESGYATPHSPVGRLCAYLKPGYVDWSPAWGEYRVLETRLFDRFDGAHFEENVRNFLRMTVDGDRGNARVTDLRTTVETRPLKSAAIVTAQAGKLEPQAPAAEPSTVAEPEQEAMASPVISLVQLSVVEDTEESALPFELDDAEDMVEADAQEAEEYYGLSEVFFVDRTLEQDQIISRSPLGPMFVEGVAGSGKTSAALGRTKMLCDFNAVNITDEVAFREIAGEQLDYWSGKYAGQFSQEGSIGFVRTGELIQYLKETSRRIDLPNLPVSEYKELQSKLRQHRGIERSSTPGWRWAGLPEPRNSHLDTTMIWLYAADRSVASVFADKLTNGLPTAEEVGALFIPEHRERVTQVVAAAITQLRAVLKPIEASLRQPPSAGRFALDRLASRLYRATQETRTRVLAKDVMWFHDGGQLLFTANERDMAALLIQRKIPLFLKSTARLVFLGDQGPLDSSLTLLSQDGQPMEWGENVVALMKEGVIIVKDANGQVFRAARSDQDDLYLRLLPEAIDRVFTLRDGALRRLKIDRGLGRVKLKLASVVKDEEEETPEEEDIGSGRTQNAVVDRQHRSIDAVVTRFFRKALVQPLIYLADAYLESLVQFPSNYPDLALARQIQGQLEARKLADEDIDLLLCLAHFTGREFQNAPSQLKEGSFYQSVFIDEVQDFTEQQIYLMAEQARPEYRAITVVGDIAQKLHHGSQIDIPACFPGQSVPRVRLTENLRQLDAPGLAWFSACFRAELQDGTASEIPSGLLLKRLKESSGPVRGPELKHCSDALEMDKLIVESLRQIHNGHTVAVILPNAEMASAIHQRLRTDMADHLVDAELSEKVDLSRRYVRHFTSVLNAKGLEFDVVILPHIEAYDLEDASHVNRLYVGLTRARKKLLLLSIAQQPSPSFARVLSRYEATVTQI